MKEQIQYVKWNELGGQKSIILAEDPHTPMIQVRICQNHLNEELLPEGWKELAEIMVNPKIFEEFLKSTRGRSDFTSSAFVTGPEDDRLAQCEWTISADDKSVLISPLFCGGPNTDPQFELTHEETRKLRDALNLALGE